MDNHQFTTEDTAVAAWLSIKGISLIRIDHDRFPSSFVFDDPLSVCTRLSNDFYFGKAEGNISNYHQAWRALIREVKSANDE